MISEVRAEIRHSEWGNWQRWTREKGHSNGTGEQEQLLKGYGSPCRQDTWLPICKVKAQDQEANSLPRDLSSLLTQRFGDLQSQSKSFLGPVLLQPPEEGVNTTTTKTHGAVGGGRRVGARTGPTGQGKRVFYTIWRPPNQNGYNNNFQFTCVMEERPLPHQSLGRSWQVLSGLAKPSNRPL